MDGTRNREPMGASAATSAAPAMLPAPTRPSIGVVVNDRPTLAPIWNVVATMLAPMKITSRSAADCVCSPAGTGPISAAFISYNYTMAKQAISVTLNTENLTWLKGRAAAVGQRSVSDLLDEIVAAARGAGQVGAARSVVGTIA